MYLTKYNPFNTLLDEFFAWPSLITAPIAKPTTEYYAELKDGVYTSQIALPKTLDLDKINCEIKDGVLTVSCPVKVEGRKVEVKQ